ncbi:hypothetical protein BD309DRAFT_950443 [Dichomitus squalens]|nr:hypothetical protein BD309DRAFT_950443 [Dichomitus squalens]
MSSPSRPASEFNGAQYVPTAALPESAWVALSYGSYGYLPGTSGPFPWRYPFLLFTVCAHSCRRPSSRSSAPGSPSTTRTPAHAASRRTG